MALVVSQRLGLRALELSLMTPLNKLVIPSHSLEKVFLPDLGDHIPATVDWRKYLPTFTHQQDERSCWAVGGSKNVTSFSFLIGKPQLVTAFELMEDYRYRLSLLCLAYSRKYWNDENMLARNPYISNYRAFPEIGLQWAMRKGLIDGYIHLPPCWENLLLRAVAQQPVIVSMELTSDLVLNKNGGVFDENFMNQLNHSVNVIGYDYHARKFLLDNSMGKDWGPDDGYFHVRRGVGKEGAYGILLHPIIPYVNDHMTQFNRRLINKLGARAMCVPTIGCYCCKATEKILNNPEWPEFIKDLLTGKDLRTGEH